MRKIVVAGCLIASLSTQLDGGTEGTRPFLSDAELKSLVRRIQSKEDLLVYVDGKQLRGEIENLPALVYPFSTLQFKPKQIAIAAFSLEGKETKMKVLTNDGHVFQAAIQDSVNFRQFAENSGEIDPSQINYILAAGDVERSLPSEAPLFRLDLNNGDQLTAYIRDVSIPVRNGWKTKQIAVNTVLNLSYNGSLSGRMLHEDKEIELPISFLKDSVLNIEIPSNHREISIPWDQISHVRRYDRQTGQFYRQDSAVTLPVLENPRYVNLERSNYPFEQNKMKQLVQDISRIEREAEMEEEIELAQLEEEIDRVKEELFGTKPVKPSKNTTFKEVLSLDRKQDAIDSEEIALSVIQIQKDEEGDTGILTQLSQTFSGILDLFTPAQEKKKSEAEDLALRERTTEFFLEDESRWLSPEEQQQIMKSLEEQEKELGSQKIEGEVDDQVALNQADFIYEAGKNVEEETPELWADFNDIVFIESDEEDTTKNEGNTSEAREKQSVMEQAAELWKNFKEKYFTENLADQTKKSEEENEFSRDEEEIPAENFKEVMEQTGSEKADEREDSKENSFFDTEKESDSTRQKQPSSETREAPVAENFNEVMEQSEIEVKAQENKNLQEMLSELWQDIKGTLFPGEEAPAENFKEVMADAGIRTGSYGEGQSLSDQIGNVWEDFKGMLSQNTNEEKTADPEEVPPETFKEVMEESGIKTDGSEHSFTDQIKDFWGSLTSEQEKDQSETETTSEDAAESDTEEEGESLSELWENLKGMFSSQEETEDPQEERTQEQAEQERIPESFEEVMEQHGIEVETHHARQTTSKEGVWEEFRELILSESEDGPIAENFKEVLEQSNLSFTEEKGLVDLWSHFKQQLTPEFWEEVSVQHNQSTPRKLELSSTDRIIEMTVTSPWEIEGDEEETISQEEGFGIIDRIASVWHGVKESVFGEKVKESETYPSSSLEEVRESRELTPWDYMARAWNSSSQETAQEAVMEDPQANPSLLNKISKIWEGVRERIRFEEQEVDPTSYYAYEESHSQKDPVAYEEAVESSGLMGRFSEIWEGVKDRFQSEKQEVETNDIAYEESHFEEAPATYEEAQVESPGLIGRISEIWEGVKERFQSEKQEVETNDIAYEESHFEEAPATYEEAQVESPGLIGRISEIWDGLRERFQSEEQEAEPTSDIAYEESYFEEAPATYEEAQVESPGLIGRISEIWEGVKDRFQSEKQEVETNDIAYEESHFEEAPATYEEAQVESPGLIGRISEIWEGVKERFQSEKQEVEPISDIAYEESYFEEAPATYEEAQVESTGLMGRISEIWEGVKERFQSEKQEAETNDIAYEESYFEEEPVIYEETVESTGLIGRISGILEGVKEGFQARDAYEEESPATEEEAVESPGLMGRISGIWEGVKERFQSDKVQPVAYEASEEEEAPFLYATPAFEEMKVHLEEKGEEKKPSEVTPAFEEMKVRSEENDEEKKQRRSEIQSEEKKEESKPEDNKTSTFMSSSETDEIWRNLYEIGDAKEIFYTEQAVSVENKDFPETQYSEEDSFSLLDQIANVWSNILDQMTFSGESTKLAYIWEKLKKDWTVGGAEVAVIEEYHLPQKPENMIYLASPDRNVPGVYILKRKVLNREYRAFLDATGYETNWMQSGSDEQPIVNISYEDAEAYAAWNGMRLPTEKEWLKARQRGLIEDVEIVEWTQRETFVPLRNRGLNREMKETGFRCAKDFH